MHIAKAPGYTCGKQDYIIASETTGRSFINKMFKVSSVVSKKEDK
jgi:hypothetical protein